MTRVRIGLNMKVEMMKPPDVDEGDGVALGVTGVRVRVAVACGGAVGGRFVALGGTGVSVEVGSSVTVDVGRGVEVGGSGVWDGGSVLGALAPRLQAMPAANKVEAMVNRGYRFGVIHILLSDRNVTNRGVPLSARPQFGHPV
jgi:hypothetical protein